MSIAGQLLLLGFVVCGAALISALDAAVGASRKSQLRRMVKEGTAGAARILDHAEAPGRLTVLVQFWLGLFWVLSGLLAGVELLPRLEGALRGLGTAPGWAGAAAFFLLGGGLVLVLFVFGSLIPRRIATANPERVGVRLSSLLGALGWLTAPLTRLFGAGFDRTGKAPGGKPVPGHVPAGSEEEVRALMEQGLNAGVLHRAEKEMVDKVLAMDELRVTAIMTPRPKIVFLNIDDPEETNWRKIVASGHSYFPVYQGSRNQIVGVVAVKALWANSAIGLPAKLKDLVTPHLAVPDRMTSIQLLEQFKRSGRHFAMVVDEYGGVVGLITLIDVLEAIVGDIPDSARRDAPGARQRHDGTWLVDAALSAQDLKALLKVEHALPHEGDAEFKTLGGFVLAQLGRIPREGELFDWNGWRFEVVDMDHLRVDKVLVSRSPVAGIQPPSQ